MSDLVQQMHCPQQIHIPPTFPFILKEYAKATIRTQPYDLLRWSAAYFRALAQGDEPPVKKRLEYPPVNSPSGLTPGYLKILLKQIQTLDTVPTETLREKWQGICLNENALSEILKVGGFTENVPWMKFIAVAAGHLTNSLTMTMCLICELLTEDPEDGHDMIPFETFKELYTYLAQMDCSSGNTKPAAAELGSGVNVPGIGPVIPAAQVQSVLQYLEFCARQQSGMVKARNIQHHLCPSLDKVPLSEQ